MPTKTSSVSLPFSSTRHQTQELSRELTEPHNKDRTLIRLPSKCRCIICRKFDDSMRPKRTSDACVRPQTVFAALLVEAVAWQVRLQASWGPDSSSARHLVAGEAYRSSCWVRPATEPSEPECIMGFYPPPLDRLGGLGPVRRGVSFHLRVCHIAIADEAVVYSGALLRWAKEGE